MLQPIILYDASDRRVWLVDGASALLHLLRISLHRDKNDEESTYDWVYDASQLKDKWDGCTGRVAALKTLKYLDNRDLRLYATSRAVNEAGQATVKYATLETRVKKLLHSMEILIHRQVAVAAREGIRLSQTLDLRRHIAGFDILDVISPLGPVHPRIQRVGSRGPWWGDLVATMGMTTIFGSGWEDLIRPEDPAQAYRNWASVPTGLDYIAVSVSTLKILYKQRAKRMDPDLGTGELTRKIVWMSSPRGTFEPCECVRGLFPGATIPQTSPSHHSPV